MEHEKDEQMKTEKLVKALAQAELDRDVAYAKVALLQEAAKRHENEQFTLKQTLLRTTQRANRLEEGAVYAQESVDRVTKEILELKKENDALNKQLDTRRWGRKLS